MSGGPAPDGTILVSGLREDEYGPVIAALVACGAPAEQVRPAIPEQRRDAREMARSAALVVLGGGHDLDPGWYGEEPVTEPEIVFRPDRDELDRELFLGAREARTPVFGLCRGMQVVNVELGGTLWQDLPSQRPAGVDHQVSRPLQALAHPLTVDAPDSPIGRILARQPAWVNSRHHQGVRRLAEGLVPVASSPDGLVEACELVPAAGEGWWLRCVQWHPENLVAPAAVAGRSVVEQQRALWHEVLAAAGVRGARRGAMPAVA